MFFVSILVTLNQYYLFNFLIWPFFISYVISVVLLILRFFNENLVSSILFLEVINTFCILILIIKFFVTISPCFGSILRV